MSASASILPPSFTICLFQMGQQFFFIFPWKQFCILKWAITEFKIVMIKSRVTGIVLILSHKNCMRISNWDSLSINLERGLALSIILFVRKHIIIIPLTSDTVRTVRLFYYGKYWNKSTAGSTVKTVFFSRSSLSVIFIQYNIVVARGTAQTDKLTVAAQKSLKSLRVLTTNMERISFPLYLKKIE